MDKHKLLEAVAKIYLAQQYSEGLLLTIKGSLERNLKQELNIASKSTSNFCKSIEKLHTETSIEYAENDVDLFTKLVDTFVKAEYNGKLDEVLNHFFETIKKYDL